MKYSKISIQHLVATIVEENFTASALEETGGFVPFAAATDGLTGQQASAIPAEGINSVWAVVQHITYLQDAVRNALRNEAAEPPSMEKAWPPIGDVSDENWKMARQKALDSNHQLAETIAVLTDDQLDQRLPGWFNNLARVAIITIYGHVSYHTAEIVTIRHMQGLKVDHLFA